MIRKIKEYHLKSYPSLFIYLRNKEHQEITHFNCKFPTNLSIELKNKIKSDSTFGNYILKDDK